MNIKLKNTVIILAILLLIGGVYIFKRNTTNNEKGENSNLTKTDTNYTLYNFGYDGCYYCEQMKPIFEKYRNSYENITFQAVDIFKDVELANKYSIEYTPTFVIINSKGEVIDQKVGDISEEEFKNFVEKNIK